MTILKSGVGRCGRIALLAAVWGAPVAWAVDAPHPSTLNARQIRSCMFRRMIADKALSYNDAKRTCAEQLKAAQTNVTPLPLAAAGRQGG
jgi:membrane peptidoglycan carboxypeptidase